MSIEINSEPTAETATPAQTRAELKKVSGSGYPKVRHILRQHPDDVADRVSVLGPMVTARKRRSLVAYLLLLTIWPWLSKQERPLPAAVWARALSTDKGRQWTTTNVSAAWADLEKRGLVVRRRLSRGVVIEPRREDGAEAYTSPGTIAGDRRETYFIVPPEFWEEEWFERLSLPGLAMLLIIAGETSDKSEVWLTHEKTALWYGFSQRSVEAGIEDLRKQGLLNERIVWTTAPLSAIGKTQQHWYSLSGAFSFEARQRLQASTRADRLRRTNQAAKKAKKTAKKSSAVKATTKASKATSSTAKKTTKSTKKTTMKKGA